MKMRYIYLFILLLLPTLCWADPMQAPKTGQSPSSLELLFWTTETQPDRVETIKYIARAYEAEQGVHVNVVSINENDFVRRFRQAAITGNQPDLVNAGDESILALSFDGWLDSAAMTKTINTIGRENFYRGALESFKSPHSKLFNGIPFHGWVQGLWYRKDWFKEHNLEEPNTCKKILHAARKLHQPERHTFGILIGTKDDNYASQVFSHIALAHGASLLDTKGHPRMTAQPMVRAATFYKKLAAYTPEGENTWRARDYYLQGKLAMMFYSTFIMDDFVNSGIAANSLTGNNFADLTGAAFDPSLISNTGVVTAIDCGKKAGYGVINALGIPQKKDQSRCAGIRAFVQFLFRADAYTTWLHMAPGGMLPVLRNIAEDEHFFRDMSGIFHSYGNRMFRSLSKGLESRSRLVPDPESPFSDAAATALAEGMLSHAVYDILHSSLSPRKALTKNSEILKRLLTNSAKFSPNRATTQ